MPLARCWVGLDLEAMTEGGLRGRKWPPLLDRVRGVRSGLGQGFSQYPGYLTLFILLLVPLHLTEDSTATRTGAWLTEIYKDARWG